MNRVAYESARHAAGRFRRLRAAAAKRSLSILKRRPIFAHQVRKSDLVWRIHEAAHSDLMDAFRKAATAIGRRDSEARP